MFRIQSPTRFDLAGGTLDLWPIWALLQEATTVNVSMDIYTYCDLTPAPDKTVTIQSDDLKKTWTFDSLADLLQSGDKDLDFFKAHFQHWMPEQGFSIRTRSDSPVGGGLGGSSSLSISIYKAFMQWLGRPVDVHEMVRHCSNIEALVLKTPTGTQDYYGAAVSGLNIIDFNSSGSRLTTLHTHRDDFMKHFMIVYTGKSHHSGINNWQVLKKFIDGDATTRRALEAIQKAGSDMKSLCLAGSWDQIPRIFADEFAARQLLAESFMSEEISRLKTISDQAGALGFKICGAGGGGCVVVWCPPEKREGIRDAVQREGFQVLKAKVI